MKRIYQKPKARLEIPWKEWLANEAEKLGVKTHTLNIRILRGKHHVSHPVKRGKTGRAISVIIPNPQLP